MASTIYPKKNELLLIVASDKYDGASKMRMGTKTKRNLAIGFAIFMAFSSILINHTAATDGGLNLPSTPVIIEVHNSIASYFNITLSDVPLSYDVTNGTYLGWCVDTSANMEPWN